MSRYSLTIVALLVAISALVAQVASVRVQPAASEPQVIPLWPEGVLEQSPMAETSRSSKAVSPTSTGRR